MIKYFLILFCLFQSHQVSADWSTYQTVNKLVKFWSSQIGKELYQLSDSMTRKEQVIQSFESLKDKIYRENGATLVEDVAREIRILMENKVKSVKRIAEYAEFLSYHRPNDTLFPNSSYDFYNTDNLTNTSPRKAKEEELQENFRLAECDWWCYQKDLEPLKYNHFTRNEIDKLFELRNRNDVGKECDCDNPPDRSKSSGYFNWLPLYDHPNYQDRVNLNLSIVKLPANIFSRDSAVLEGVRWSEALDLIFKDNLLKDPTLKYQYFASPVGFMRHFPALQWSQEPYDKTYDFRTRSWYTEAVTSPKDVIILLDRSGSMKGKKRILSAQIVNNILDTLNDNDFVNIYTFTNTTEPLVDCFDETLVQANEENLRLLRESLDVYKIEFVADIWLGLEKAFDILANFRKNTNSSQCNQAIMLITEGVDYDYRPNLFIERNWKNNTPVRIFTYQLDKEPNDAVVMEWIACANMGFYVNMSLLTEIREKVLNYLNVMSRPVNYNFMSKQEAIWSYLYVDLADRRYSNWLWRKFEGIRQRQVFLDHAKREFLRLRKVLTSSNHMLLQETHEYSKYEAKYDYDYMTTVSLPVYGRRKNEVELIGVAGVDIPIRLLNSLVPHQKLGVNGYAFILTNNGYLLMHPRHRREFKGILKPTFNRVDFLEVEILDDLSEPRLFDKSIVDLREKIVHRQKGNIVFKVKNAVEDMKRLILSKRRYYYTEIGPFSFGIALPDKYGLMIVNNTHQITSNFKDGLLNTKNWKIHPDWVYCRDCGGKTPEDNVKNCLKIRKKCKPLFASLLYDAFVTSWFEQAISNEKYYTKKYFVSNVFLATHSGLTRWRTFQNEFMEEVEDQFETQEQRAIDEDWYKRTVEDNYHFEDMFIYSVPFEISGYENNTLITSTNAIFVQDSKLKTPVAVVGLQFNHRAMYQLYNSITTKCNRSSCYITCESDFLTCVILDNNAYVILADEIEYTGRYIGDIRPDIMYHLVKNGVYKATRMFDYQAICQKQPPTKSRGSHLQQFIRNFLQIFNWTLSGFFLLIQIVLGRPDYQSIKEDTLAYERLEINKTVPTPCDHEMWLFTLGNNFSSGTFANKTSKFDCAWPYVVDRIPNSNLLFLAINARCKVDTTYVYHKSPAPTEIIYNETLPCYIAVKNNYTRRIYMNCYNRDEREFQLNKIDKFHCGHTWK